MRRTARVRLAATVAALGMLTAACGGSDFDDSESTGGGSAGGDLRIYRC